MSTFPRHSDQTATRPAPQISEERRQTVETARRSWIRKLIDLSRRNNLTSASSERLRDLLVGESVSAAKLLSNLEDDVLEKILRDISRRALENSEEKGSSTLFVTFGMATWPALDGGRSAEAPVLLLPVAISKKEGSNSYYLSAAGSFQLNLVLLHVLEDQFKVKLQPEELLAEFPIQLLRWIASDGQLRTDDQIVDEMVAVLGFSRRGVRIERAIRSAITCWRQRA